MATQTVQELIDGFPHKPDEYAITTNPSRDEVKHVRKCIQANLAPSRIPCFQPETLDQGWKFLAQRQDEWEDAHHRRKEKEFRDQPVDPNVIPPITYTAPTTFPPMPTYNNPMRLDIDATWTEKRTVREIYLHKENQEAYIWQLNLNQALTQCLKKAVPKELLMDLQDLDGVITHTPKEILAHLEDLYDRIRPKDIDAIMKDFNTPYDANSSVVTYLGKQQECQKLLKKTAEPISEATLIRVSFGSFQLLPYMIDQCRLWEDRCDATVATPTWPDFKHFFVKKFLQHTDTQESLQSAGIANLANTDNSIAGLQEQLAIQQQAMIAQSEARDLQVSTLAGQLLAIQQANQASTHDPSPSVSSTITTSTNKEVLSVLADLAKMMESKTSIDSNDKNGKRKRKFPKETGPRTVRRFPNNENYCWSHGADIAANHDSSNCRWRKDGHKDTATIDDRKGGSDANVKLLRP